MQRVKQSGTKYHFLSLSYDDLGLNLSLPGHWWTLYQLGQWTDTYLLKILAFTIQHMILIILFRDIYLEIFKIFTRPVDKI